VIVIGTKLIRIALAAVLIAASELFAGLTDTLREEMLKLVDEKSCKLWHSNEPRKVSTEALLPFAPAWKDIARKYRGQKMPKTSLRALC
jgi:hypothetical protein